ncbi:hypothetical protein D9M72_539540 [compost metagenome]
MRELRNQRKPHIGEHTHQHGVAQGAEAGPLPQRNPEKQDEEAHDHHHRSDGKACLPGQALMENIPGVKAKAGTDEHGQRNAVHGQAGKQLKESSGHHGNHPPAKLAL